MATNSDLSQYIVQARQAGLNDDAIRQELLRAGWGIDDVNTAIPPRVPSGPPAPFMPPEASKKADAIPSGTIVKAKRNHWPFIIISILLLLTGGAVYFFLPQILLFVDRLKGTAPVEAPIDQETPIPATDAENAWSVYRDVQHALEFQYPKRWNVPMVSVWESLDSLSEAGKNCGKSQDLGELLSACLMYDDVAPVSVQNMTYYPIATTWNENGSETKVLYLYFLRADKVYAILFQQLEDTTDVIEDASQVIATLFFTEPQKP